MQMTQPLFNLAFQKKKRVKVEASLPYVQKELIYSIIKTLELVPNVDRVVVIMTIKEIATMQIKISNVQVHYYCIAILTYHHCLAKVH